MFIRLATELDVINNIKSSITTLHKNNALRLVKKSHVTCNQCDQIWRFIGLWASF